MVLLKRQIGKRKIIKREELTHMMSEYGWELETEMRIGDRNPWRSNWRSCIDCLHCDSNLLRLCLLNLFKGCVLRVWEICFWNRADLAFNSNCSVNCVIWFKVLLWAPIFLFCKMRIIIFTSYNWGEDVT